MINGAAFHPEPALAEQAHGFRQQLPFRLLHNASLKGFGGISGEHGDGLLRR